MYDPVSICNLALAHLGKEPITSLTEDNNLRARLCNNFYGVSFRSVLEEEIWTFAEVTQLIETEVQSDVPNMRALSLESHVWRLYRVYKPGTTENMRGWYRSHNRLYIPAFYGSAIIVYTSGKTAESQLTASFVEALSFKLACRLCMPLTKDKGLKNSLKDDYENAMMEATSADGQQVDTEVARASDFILARRR